jgi:type II secretion system protein N
MRLKWTRAVTGYVLAGIVMLLVFLAIRFPAEALRDYAEAFFSARYPRLLFSLDAIRPSFPPGIVLSGITVSLRDRPDATTRLDVLTVRPGWLPLFSGRFAIVMAAETSGGEMSGGIDFSRMFSFQGPLRASLDLQGLRVEKIAWLREALARPITGTLRGSIAFSGQTEALQKGTGTFDMVLTSGTFPLVEKFLGLDKIDFTRVEAKISFRDGALKITQLTLNGDQLRASLKGNIILADDMRDSQIDLSGTMEAPLQGNKRVTISIGGTLANPKGRFI